MFTPGLSRVLDHVAFNHSVFKLIYSVQTVLETLQ